ncbi:MAG: DUF1643 domain-containing protein [Gammaproteobacteria bacterium]|nr:DUF1643 domain-containing protein [Gammaproteobacteria bacterium]
MAGNYHTVFSKDRLHRYLWRFDWDDKPPLVVIGLNPSTADENVTDPTVTRCIRYAQSWGHGSLWMMNLFAFRATDPRVMKAAADPIGPDNGRHLLECCAYAVRLYGGKVLGAWGNHGTFMNRSREVLQLLKQNASVPVYALRVTKANQPQHPLYLPANLAPFVFQGEADAA